MEHNFHFQICDSQLILWSLQKPIFLCKLPTAKHSQISAGKQKAPDCSLIFTHQAVYELLINRYVQMLPGKKSLKTLFHISISFSEQLTHQTVGTCVGPVSSKFPFVQIIDDRPGIINI